MLLLIASSEGWTGLWDIVGYICAAFEIWSGTWISMEAHFLHIIKNNHALVNLNYDIERQSFYSLGCYPWLLLAVDLQSSDGYSDQKPPADDESVNRRSAGNLQDKVTLTYTRPDSEVTQLEHIYILSWLFSTHTSSIEAWRRTKWMGCGSRLLWWDINESCDWQLSSFVRKIFIAHHCCFGS